MIVLVPDAKPGALAVTVTVPVPESPCKTKEPDEPLAPTFTLMAAEPAVVVLFESRSLVESPLVSVTTNPPTGATAASEKLVVTSRELPTVALLRKMLGAVTVAVADVYCAGVLKPEG